MSFIQASGNPGGTIPSTIEKALAAGYAEYEGAPLIVNNAGQFDVAGADPAQIAAFAVGRGGVDTSGYNILGHYEFPPGYMQGTRVDGGVLFRCMYVGALPANPGGNYGIIKDVDNLWKIDFNEIVNICLNYVGGETDSPESQPYVFVRVLPGSVQPA